MNRHKYMRIYDKNLPKQMEFFVTVHTINSCKMVFPYHLWGQFIDQTQSN